MKLGRPRFPNTTKEVNHHGHHTVFEPFTSISLKDLAQLARKAVNWKLSKTCINYVPMIIASSNVRHWNIDIRKYGLSDYAHSYEFLFHLPDADQVTGLFQPYKLMLVN
jgi:hypothetical protein